MELISKYSEITYQYEDELEFNKHKESMMLLDWELDNVNVKVDSGKIKHIKVTYVK